MFQNKISPAIYLRGTKPSSAPDILLAHSVYRPASTPPKRKSFDDGYVRHLRELAEKSLSEQNDLNVKYVGFTLPEEAQPQLTSVIPKDTLNMEFGEAICRSIESLAPRNMDSEASIIRDVNPLPNWQMRCRRNRREMRRCGRRALLQYPRCQVKYEKIFSKPRALLKKKSLLPSYRRSNLCLEEARVQTGCRAWTYKQKVQWNKVKIKFKEIGIRLELWSKSFKTIEGHYGSGVASYFVFLRWLFLLNLLIFALVFVFVVVPQVAFVAEGYDFSVVGNTSDGRINLSAVCTSYYSGDTANYTTSAKDLVIDFLQGTGWMEPTVLFHGYFADRSLAIGTFEGKAYSYNMPLAYLLVTIIIFVLSLILMVRHTASGFKNRLLEQEDKYYKYCCVVFGGWDYTLNDPKTAKLKHKSLWNELVADLEEERRLEKRMRQTTCQDCILYAVRFFINVFVVIVLAGSGFLIYYATTESLKFSKRSDYSTINDFVKLLMEYVPSLTIAFLNFLVPVIFEKIVTGEDYTPEWEIHVTLGRTVFLRLASLGVLLGTIYTQITCGTKDTCNVGTGDCFSVRCWETYVGQQVYKLVIMDFFTVMAVIILIDFPRRIIVTKCDCKLFKIIGKAEFYIPKNVLDLVYSQTLCWLGAFFSPLIPAICVMESFLVFYMKKITCIFNHVPPARPYRASRSHSFFMVVLLSAFVLCCVPIGYVIWKIPPSYGCGPFRVYRQIWEIIPITISASPDLIQQTMTFIDSPGFIIPLFVVLLLLIYYYISMSSANKDMVALMKQQLIMEGKDKQFLLARINEITGQGPPGMNKGKSIRAANLQNGALSSPQSPRAVHQQRSALPSPQSPRSTTRHRSANHLPDDHAPPNKHAPLADLADV